MAFKFGLVLLVAGLCSAASSVPNRIVGGELTTVEHYPAIVQVEFHNVWGGTWSQSCAGSILNSRNVVTAAHCMSGTASDANNRRIRAGTTYRNTGGQVVSVFKSTMHGDYGKNQYDNDIGLLHLVDNLVYNPVVQQVTIVSQGFEIPDNTPVVHAGWGATSQGGSTSNQLRDVTIYTINHGVCQQRYGYMPVTQNMICAGILDQGGKDACQGDSGGPLYLGQILVGIVSWGNGCAQAYYPGVSTRVASYTNWILENIV